MTTALCVLVGIALVGLLAVGGIRMVARIREQAALDRRRDRSQAVVFEASAQLRHLQHQAMRNLYRVLDDGPSDQ